MLYPISSQGALAMPTIRLLRSGQVTLPAKIREAFNLKEGAFFDTKVKGDSIVLTPKALVEQRQIHDKAKQRFFKIVDKIWEKNKDADPEEVERDVAEALAEVRARHQNK
jgi:AbrB family looped-hinge helix DNA binding protein